MINRLLIVNGSWLMAQWSPAGARDRRRPPTLMNYSITRMYDKYWPLINNLLIDDINWLSNDRKCQELADNAIN